MSDQQAKLSPAEIRRVFRALGLSTQKERDRFLAPESPVPSLPSPPKEHGHELQISNRSLSLEGEGQELAKLG